MFFVSCCMALLGGYKYSDSIGCPWRSLKFWRSGFQGRLLWTHLEKKGLQVGRIRMVGYLDRFAFYEFVRCGSYRELKECIVAHFL